MVSRVYPANQDKELKFIMLYKNVKEHEDNTKSKFDSEGLISVLVVPLFIEVRAKTFPKALKKALRKIVEYFESSKKHPNELYTENFNRMSAEELYYFNHPDEFVSQYPGVEYCTANLTDCPE